MAAHATGELGEPSGIEVEVVVVTGSVVMGSVVMGSVVTVIDG
jgi:hypothetical protein